MFANDSAAKVYRATQTVGRRIAALLIAALLLQTAGIGGGEAIVEASVEGLSDYNSTVPTPQGNEVINPDYDRSWDDYVVVSDSSGLVHPGVLHSRSDLNLMRDMVWQGREPWASGFEKLRTSPESAKEIVIYGNGGTQQAFQYSKVSDSSGDKQLRQDATTAYQQALMWYITGDNVYRDNAVAVLDAWAEGLNQFFDTTEPANWDDVAKIWGASSVLSSGVAGQKMAAAAEILLYTPSSGWLRDDDGNIDYDAKAKYDRFFRLIWQESNKWYGYFNQAAVGNAGYMAIAVFLDDLNGYNEAVERFAVNKKAVDDANANASNSINFSVAAMVLDSGQIVEMGRDQPHSAVDIGALAGAARTIFVQGTQLHPVTGVPVEGGGVNPYEFQDRKLLKMISYFSKYNLGLDVEFQANVNGLGQKAEFPRISVAGRGAYAEMVSIYNYYKYIAGYEGPEFDELYKYPAAMIERHFPEGGSIDHPGFGQLLFTPLSGAWDEEPKGPPQPVSAVQNNYERYNRHPVIPFSSNNEIFFKNGYVKPNIASYTDEDGAIQYKAEGTMNGNWIGYEGFDFGDGPNDTIAFSYSLNATSGSTISVYVTDPEVKLTDETMNTTEPIAVFQVPHTGWWSIVNTHVHKMTSNSEKLSGIKNVYFKISGSNNVYNLAAEAFWFQFSGAYARTDNKAADASVKSENAYSEDVSGSVSTLSGGGYIGYRNVNFDRGTRQLELRYKATGSGALEMRLGGPNGGLVKSYPIADTAGESITSFFEHEDNEVIYGNNGGLNDLYFVYVGEGTIELDSFKYGDIVIQQVEDPTKNKGAGYQYDNGKAVKSGDSVILQGDGSQVIYQNANAGSRNGERGFMAIRVKSDEPMTIKAIDLLRYETELSTVAEFNVPDTEGEFVTLAYDLAQSNYQNFEGMKFLRLETSGGTAAGRAEIEYFTFNNEEIEFQDAMESVSIESSNSNQSIATAGDTITLSFTATEPIDDVSVYFGSTLMPVSTVSQTEFKVELTLGENYKPGKVNFRIDYNVGGAYGKSATATTNGTEVTIVDEEGLINEAFMNAGLIDSTPGRAMDLTKQIVSYLFDRTDNTGSDFRSESGGWGSWIAFDFGVNRKVQLDEVKLKSNLGFPNRAAGIVIQGKNHWDYDSWTTLTTSAVNTTNWQTLDATNNTPYRYLRVFNAGQWFGNMDELKFFGTVIDISPVALSSVTLVSDNEEDARYAEIGDTVTLRFTAEEEISGVQVQLGGAAVTAVSDDQIHWTAAFKVEDIHQQGNIPFTIIYDDAPLVNTTTDGSTVTLIKGLSSALAEAENLNANHYTRLSFHLFRAQLEQVKEAMNEPDYSTIALSLQLEAALNTLEDVPISLYSFENNTNNAYGDSHGTVTGTTYYTAGKKGQAIDFNGSTHVTLPGDHSLADYDEITIATWVNWRGGNDWQRIFDFGNDTNQYMFLSPRSGNNPLRFAIKNGGAEQIVQSNAPLAVGEWVHVAVTLGSGTAKLYVNGVETGSAAATIKPSDFKPKVNYIGKSMYNDPLFNGLLDEFMIYNSALSASDIVKLYNDQLNWVDTSLLNELLNEAASVNRELYTIESMAALDSSVWAAQQLQTQEQSTQRMIDDAAEELALALGGLVLEPPIDPQEIVAAISGPAEAAQGEEVDWTVSINGDTAFSIMDVTFEYDPSHIEFAVVDEDGKLFLAEGAVVPLDADITALAAGVNAVTGEIRMLLSRSGNKPITGPLFKLIGSIKEDAALGATSVSLQDFVMMQDDLMVDVDTESASAVLSIIAPDEAPDKTELQNLVNQATALIGSAQQGSAPGQYPEQAIHSFGVAIEIARDVLHNASATNEDIAAAIQSLQTAITVFRQSANPQIPVDPADKSALITALAAAESLLDSTVGGNKIGQYSPDAREALEDAVAAGTALKNNTGATQTAIDAAKAELDRLISEYKATIVTLVPGQTRITIRDLAIIARYLGTGSHDDNWSEIEAADVFNQNSIDISTLAAVARMILEEWLDEK